MDDLPPDVYARIVEHLDDGWSLDFIAEFEQVPLAVVEEIFARMRD